MKSLTSHRILSYLIALVWLINGLFCKVLDLVPRHQQIVSQILGNAYAGPLTILIGVSEIGMAVWIVSGIKSRFNAVLQILVVTAMNILEFILVPDLLLWGRFNALFAGIFIALIYYNEYRLNPKYT